MREKISLNEDWIFVSNNKKNLKKTKRVPKGYEKINLPHSLNNYNLASGSIPQTKMWYKKDFHIDPRFKGKIILLEFEGVMHSCRIFFNGKNQGEYKGGFTPIIIDITKLASFGKYNTLVLQVSNLDDKLIPPGVSLTKSEYQYFGGIYRSVNLITKESVHITEVDYTGKVSGNFYLYDETIKKNLAVLATRVEVHNSGKHAANVTVTANIYDRQGRLVHIYTSPDVNIKAGANEIVEVTSRVDNPNFWSPNFPYLYDVEYLVTSNGGITDSVTVKHGFKTIRCDHRGFILNGTKIYLRGTNRIQQYPYLGMSVSDTVEYRDAYKIKRAGFNLVRLIGGGNSRAFLEACDELGILVCDCIPSQQHCRRGEYLDQVVYTVTAMARRDRNHTCIAFYEPFMSETGEWVAGASDKFFLECKEAFLKELQYGIPPLIAGDTIGRKNPKKLNFDLPYVEHDIDTMIRHLHSLPGRKGLVKGYGDYEFGEENSTSRVDRADGEAAMLLQAWNYQWSHNRNKNNKLVDGDLIWNNVDYIRPMTPKSPVCKAGIMDIFRLPKYSYYFFKAQDISPSQRFVFAPTYWNDERINVLPIFSNCEKVRLYVNGRLLGEREMDNGEQDEFTISAAGRKRNKSSEGDVVSDNWASAVMGKRMTAGSALATHTMTTMYDGNNANKLIRAPFTFTDIAYEAGELKAEGLINGKAVCKYIVRTPDVPQSIKIKIDYSAKALVNDGVDFVFCHCQIVDKNGTITPISGEMITCSVEGGEIIGSSVIASVEGVATVLVKTLKESAEVIVTATAVNLEPDAANIIIQGDNISKTAEV